MSYQIAEVIRVVAGREFTVIVLAGEGSAAEIWPALGCNCLSWRTDERELLYAPDVAALVERPTRGGIPVLFPFPNRIRSGAFSFDRREYQLPLNDSTQANAIHGFTPRLPWRISGGGADARSGWLNAEFQLSREVAANTGTWPADGQLKLTIRLSGTTLSYEAIVENPDTRALPFGLGYHPYFVTTPDCRIQTPARKRWELVDNLPTGRRLSLQGGDYDLHKSKRVAGLHLDDAYTDLPNTPPGSNGLIERGRIEFPGVGVLRVRTSPAFRELVLFTPPHGKAVCLEPYTCPTDAIHLQEREDVGWQVLPPGGRWDGIVEYALSR